MHRNFISCFKYYKSDLMCDVTGHCASRFAVGKLSVYDQIVIKNLQKKKWISNKFLYEFLSKR